MEQRQDARRTRIAESEPFGPPFVWLVLVLMVVVVVTFQCLFADPSATAFGQSVAMASIAGTLCAALTPDLGVDRPFNDRGAQITPSRMEASLAIMSHEASLPASLPL